MFNGCYTQINITFFWAITAYRFASNNTIFLDPALKVNTPTQNGLIASEFFITTAHEMAHAKDYYLRGEKRHAEWFTTNTDAGKKKISISEQYACHIENRIRANRGLPLRTYYTSDGYTGIDAPLLNSAGNSNFYTQSYMLKFPSSYHEGRSSNSFHIVMPFNYKTDKK